MGAVDSLKRVGRPPGPAAWALVLLVSISCVATPPESFAGRQARWRASAPVVLPAAPAAPPGAAAAVVLVVLDGVRWQEVFDGVDPETARRQGLRQDEVVDAEHLMPTLHDVLIATGVAVGAPGFGPEMRASGPNYVSLPGYTEILTGRTATECRDNACPTVRQPTFPDEVARSGPASTTDRAAVIASWESLERAASSGYGDVVVSAGRHGGRRLDAFRADVGERALLEEGERAGAFPGEADFRPDRYTADLALRYLERERPRFLFIGLGEPDEYAHQDNYRAYLDSLRAADRALARLMGTLDRMGERGEATCVFVTTDHGRARSFRDHGGFAPESGRVWLVASGAGIASKGYLESNEPHRLADIAPTMRRLMGLPDDRSEGAGHALDEALP